MRDRSPVARIIQGAARVGHVATGSVYVVVGVVALVAAFNLHVRPMGSQGALHRVLSGWAGMLTLLALAAGLIADSAWQTVRAALNVDRAGRNVTGWVNRASWVGSGLIHLGLAITALKLALGVPQKTAEHEVKAWTAYALSVPLGQWLVAVIGGIVVAAGLVLGYRAWVGDVDRWLDLRALGRTSRALILALGRFSLLARGLVLCLGGGFLVLAAIHLSPKEARGLGGTLRAIEYQGYGALLLAGFALGFITSGFLEFMRARYRRISVSRHA